MKKEDLIASVGVAAYEAAARSLREHSARPQFGQSASDSPSDLPHELTYLIWDADCSWRDRITLFLSVYDDMPGYGHLLYSHHHYPEFSAADRAFWWAQVRERLVSAEPAIRQPLLYSLWCDYFEDPDTVTESWHAITGAPDVSRDLLLAVLPFTGPVPYALKRKLYRSLLPDPFFHEAIFFSLQGAAFDVYGSVEPRHALRVLSRLSLPANDARAALESKLRGGAV